MLPSLQAPNFMFTSLLLPFFWQLSSYGKRYFLLYKQKTKKEYPITLIDRTKNYYIKHNKTLYNFNVYYLPPLSNILQIEKKQYDMFSTVFHCKNQSTRYFHTLHLYLQCHIYTFSPRKLSWPHPI
jgi:hypothetical protein